MLVTSLHDEVQVGGILKQERFISVRQQQINPFSAGGRQAQSFMDL